MSGYLASNVRPDRRIGTGASADNLGHFAIGDVMKKRFCCSLDCGSRRAHHERPDEPRGTRQIEVEDSHPDDQPAYCSFSCACMDGAFSIATGMKWGATTRSGYTLPSKPG